MPWLRLRQVGTPGGIGSVCWPAAYCAVAVSQSPHTEMPPSLASHSHTGAGSDALVERGHRTGGEHELVVVGVMTPVGEIQELVLNLAPMARLRRARVRRAVDEDLLHPERDVRRVLRIDGDRQVVVALAEVGEVRMVRQSVDGHVRIAGAGARIEVRDAEDPIEGAVGACPGRVDERPDPTHGRHHRQLAVARRRRAQWRTTGPGRRGGNRERVRRDRWSERRAGCRCSVPCAIAGPATRTITGRGRRSHRSSRGTPRSWRPG